MMIKPAVIVTGAVGGIGRALRETFSAAGYHVIGTDRAARKASTAGFIELDLDQYARSARVRAETGKQFARAIGKRPLVCLVNNAAVQIVRPIERLTGNDWQKSLNVNVIAAFLLAQQLLERLEAAKGSVINIASIHATLTKPGFAAYATSKAALVGLTRSMAVELGNRVRVNAICPAAIDTEMLRAGFAGRDADFARLEAAHPVRRLGSPSEVASLTVMLASSKFRFISGGIFNVDGAIGARLHDPV